MEVCPLARGVMLLERNPYPVRYKLAFAFSIFLYPHFYWLALRLTFLIISGEMWAYHVPCKYLDGLGSACPPVAQHLRQVNGQHLYLSTYLLVQALSVIMSAPLACCQ